jgi:site-specific DNA-methyltransferase (adenine-specific)
MPAGTREEYIEKYYTNGRNKRSVWTLGPESYADAHFATYPTKLVEPCILAGSSSYGACSQCGAPWERVVEHMGERETHGVNKVADDARAHEPMRANGTRHGNTSVMSTGMVAVKETTGWQPTCSCNAAVMPCTVLDPFSGSGTTGAVALKHHRNYVGIDLNADYIELAHDRIRQSQPMLLDVT